MIIGANCKLRGVTFRFYQGGGKIELGDRILVNAYPRSRVFLSVKNHTSIHVESNCLISNPVGISTTDWHRIVDEDGVIVNPEKDIHIGKHVWIGSTVIIGKGVSIPDNTVIGTGSVVTKPFSEKNTVIAGNPAEIKKHRINWR